MEKKRLIVLALIICLCFPLLTFAETIILKSGKSVEGRLIEKTDKYIKIDFEGVPLTYFFDEIESIDGGKPASLLPDKNITINVTFDNPNMAIGYYKAAVNDNPNDFVAFDNLGLSYALNGQLQEAIDCFQKAINIKPDFVDAYAHLGATYNSLAQPNQAIPYLEKAVELGSQDIKTYNSLAGSYFFTNQFLKAIPWFEKVVELNPADIKAYIGLAKAYEKVGQYQKAKENFLKLEELYKEQGNYQAVQEVEELLKGIPNVSTGSD